MTSCDEFNCYGCGRPSDTPKQEEKQIEKEQAAKAQNSKIPVCYNDDDVYNSTITPNEPVDSLSMGDEQLNTIPAMKSDEFIKSCVENLVPNPSEPEGENGCDSLSDEDISEKIFSNPLFEEEIISTKIDLHHFNAESDLIESLLNRDSSIISSSSKIDSLLDEFAGELTLLKTIPPGIDETGCDPENEIHFTRRLLYDNSSPHPPEEFVSENSNTKIESFSPSPIPIEVSDSFMEEIDLSFNPDDPMPPSIEDADDDSERDILILKNLPSNYSLSLPKNESFHFDIPSFSRPPAKPPYGNTGILNIKMIGDISEQKLDLEPSVPRLLQNKEIHLEYLKNTQEQDDILWGIVKQVKAKQPLDNALDFACKHAQRILELLVYAQDTCPNEMKPSAKKFAVTPKNKVKKVSNAKSAKKHKKQNIWKPTGHVFTEVGFKWKPTSRTFAIFGNSCPSTRITSANVVPPMTTHTHSVESQKAKLKVYSRKLKTVKNIDLSKKAKIVESKNANHSEPNHTLGSNSTDISSSTSLVMTVPVAAAPRAVDLADSPVSTLIDQDALSLSTPSTQEQEQSPNISQGFVDQDKALHVYKLKKALYGLKQAPRGWYDMLSSFLISQQFSKGAVDPTLFTRQARNDLLLGTDISLTVYEDADHTRCQDTRRSTSGSAQRAIALCCNNVQHSRSKHIDVRYHFIKEQVENGIMKLYFVRTEYQLADIFTKPLPRERFNFLIEKVGMRSMSPETLKILGEETDE
nr:retrovirus-related Pol polyprotein from transposon TNT 1-94 [Tanacetum cinerariifolium]